MQRMMIAWLALSVESVDSLICPYCGVLPATRQESRKSQH